MGGHDGGGDNVLSKFSRPRTVYTVWGWGDTLILYLDFTDPFHYKYRNVKQ